jgi:predicted porin
MNMNKKLIALAVAGVFVTSSAMADVSFYGQANVSYDVINNNSSNTAANRDSQGVASNASRFGFKGSEDLGGGLSAIYQIESQIAIGAGFGGTQNSPYANTGLAIRDTFAGLKSDTAGTVRLGRFDTPYKLATRGMDMFHNTIADNRSLMGLGHDVRTSNTVGYNSLNYSGFSAAASYFGDQGGTAPGNFTPSTCCSNTANQTNEGYSVAGMYNAGPYYATAAYQSMSNNIASTLSTDAWKIGGGYSVDAFALNAVYEKVRNIHGAGSARAWYLSGKYNVTTADALKLAYTDLNQAVGGPSNSGAKQYSVGYDHKMSNRTTLYALYSKLKNDTNGSYDLGWNSGGTSISNALDGRSPSVFSAGMKHSF